MAQPMLKKDDDRDDEVDYHPFFGIEKGAVLQEARVFNDSQIDARCSQVITKLLYLLNQGDTFTQVEGTEVFFSVTKLFQLKDPGRRRMMYLMIKELSPRLERFDHNTYYLLPFEFKVIMVTSSLMKDMNSKTDMYRANAIRVLSRIIDGTILAKVFLYVKEILDNVMFMTLLSLLPNPEVVKRWSNEVQEAVQSRAPLVQFHALALLYQSGTDTTPNGHLGEEDGTVSTRDAVAGSCNIIRA